MAINMTRTFYPVGQGAFYSERFLGKDGEDHFCVVYDCGTKTSKKKVDRAAIIQDAFKDRKPIDILFISHFDKDHVSMIDELMKCRRIKRVVLPLLPVEETAVLQAHYSHVGNTIGEHLLADPIGFFHNEIVVLRVASTRSEPIELPPNHAEEIRDIPHDSDVIVLKPNWERVGIKSGDKKGIPSGARILVPLHSWCYIPHNYEYPQRHRALLKEIAKRANIERARLGEALYITEKSKELNEVYRSLQTVKCGDINENSMLVYSGPPQCPPSMLHAWGECWSDYGIYFMHEDRPACIYSGDSDFNKVKINRVYGSIWKNVGTVQIPHHGSVGSFSAGFLGNGNSFYLCPISAGRKNQHGHPSPTVLKDIQIRHSLPLIVDECPCSKLTQHIWVC